jgi:hypothetical protein
MKMAAAGRGKDLGPIIMTNLKVGPELYSLEIIRA